MPKSSMWLNNQTVILIILILLGVLISSPIVVPNTIVPGAGGIVVFSDGSTIDVTNSTSYIGTPLMIVGGGGGGGGGGNGGGKSGGDGRGRQLCLLSQLCSSTDLSEYVAFNLGSLTFMVSTWYMLLGSVFLALLLILLGFVVYKHRHKHRHR